MLGESGTIVSLADVSQESCRNVDGTLCMASMTFPIYKERIRYEGEIYGYGQGGESGGGLLDLYFALWGLPIPRRSTIYSALLSLLALYCTGKKSAAAFLRVTITITA
jgi:hypothetical protein